MVRTTRSDDRSRGFRTCSGSGDARGRRRSRTARARAATARRHRSPNRAYNRRRFNAELERQLALAQRYGARGALLLLDIDGLKQINDTHGHPTGDRAILATADLLRAHLRCTDSIARIGGDEFAVLIPHAEAQQAARIARGLLQAAHATEPAGPVTRLKLSIGITELTSASLDEASILARADAALYQINRSGGDRYAINLTD
jgi:diguanylate cyclase (GGDEF)-like protein